MSVRLWVFFGGDFGKNWNFDAAATAAAEIFWLRSNGEDTALLFCDSLFPLKIRLFLFSLSLTSWPLLSISLYVPCANAISFMNSHKNRFELFSFVPQRFCSDLILLWLWNAVQYWASEHNDNNEWTKGRRRSRETAMRRWIVQIATHRHTDTETITTNAIKRSSERSNWLS